MLNKAILICAVLALVCGTSYGATFVWIDTASGKGLSGTYDCATQSATTWQGGVVPPNDGTADIILDTAAADGAIDFSFSPGPNKNYYVSSFLVGGIVNRAVGNNLNGCFLRDDCNTTTTWSLTVGADSSGVTHGTGDFFYRSRANIVMTPGAANAKISVYGNYYYASDHWGANILPTVNLYGTNKGYFDNAGTDMIAKYHTVNLYGSYFENIDQSNNTKYAGRYSIWGGTNHNQTQSYDILDVKPTGKVLAQTIANGASRNAMNQWTLHELRLECITNPNYNLPNLGDCVDFWFMADKSWDCGTLGAGDGRQPLGDPRTQKQDWAMAGGVVYSHDVMVSRGYATNITAGTGNYVCRIQSWGDCNTTTVGQDLILAHVGSGAQACQIWFLPEENGPIANYNNTHIAQGTPLNVTVNNNMYIDYDAAVTAGWAPTEKGFTGSSTYGLKLRNVPNSSVITVKGNFYFGNAENNTVGAAFRGAGNDISNVDLGNGTLVVGGNLQITRLYRGYLGASGTVKNQYVNPGWNPGTSTIVMNGGGTGKTQLVSTWAYLDNLPFYNFTVNNPGGIVRLDNTIDANLVGRRLTQGGLWITGGLDIECGTFQQAGMTKGKISLGSWIVFDNAAVTDPTPFAGKHGKNITGVPYFWKDAIGGGNGGGTTFDNVLLMSNALVVLESNINLRLGDNLVMLSGSKIYLNGFTLNAEGHTLISDLVSENGIAAPWTDGAPGTIFGSFVSTPAPEPATLLLLGSGALGVFGYIRRRRIQ